MLCLKKNLWRLWDHLVTTHYRQTFQHWKLNPNTEDKNLFMNRNYCTDDLCVHASYSWLTAVTGNSCSIVGTILWFAFLHLFSFETFRPRICLFFPSSTSHKCAIYFGFQQFRMSPLSFIMRNGVLMTLLVRLEENRIKCTPEVYWVLVYIMYTKEALTS